MLDDVHLVPQVLPFDIFETVCLCSEDARTVELSKVTSSALAFVVCVTWLIAFGLPALTRRILVSGSLFIFWFWSNQIF
jgi:hypothetical protein